LPCSAPWRSGLRKLFPALYQLDGAGLLHEDTRIIALAREPAPSSSTWRSSRRTAPVRRQADDAVAERFLARLSYLHVDFLKAEDYVALAEMAGSAQLIAYFATAAVCTRSARTWQGRPGGKHPRGAGKAHRFDLESSRKVNDAVAQFFPENRTYRIDHYLGKETVQNLIALRFANSLFETQWNQNYISHVEITVAEKVGIEGRWGYFDKAGQLRDMIQNHLLQLLCLIAMDPPADLSADSIRDEKVKVLKALAPISPEGLTTKWCAASTSPATAKASRYRVTWKKTIPTPRATPKPSSPCVPTSATGAGPACRSTCVPASACRRSCRRSSSTSRNRRTTSSPRNSACRSATS
jgi:glucose-6-phosphate 1-dehydrogenase